MNSPRSTTWRLLFGLVALAASGVPAHAQKAPEIGYIFPPSVAAGSSAEVRLGGYDWTPDVQVFVSDPRVRLELAGPPGEILIPDPPYWFGPKSITPAWPLPRETPARLTIPADMPPGAVRWQVANANGGSSHGVFYVGAGAEAVEDEGREAPQPLGALPAAVSGRLIKIEEVDRYTFVAPVAGPVTCELFARRLGANFNGVLEVRDAEGMLVADVADTAGRDTSVTFTAQAGAEYTLTVFDLDFRGDFSFVYRLELTAGPRVVAAMPAAGRRGETREVRFIGWGVATGEARLEAASRSVAFPADATAASLPYRLETAWGTAAAFPLVMSDLPERIEPVETAADARRIELPSAITGVLAERGGEDVYCLDGKQGDVWSIEVQARRLRSPLDVALRLLGPDGADVAKNDDVAGTTDAGLSYTVAADGAYRLVVSDVSGTSGSLAAVYRLVVGRPQPGFELRTVELLNLPLGATAELLVTATRQGGFAGPIALSVASLPEGVSVPAELVISPEAAELKIAITAAADAPATAARATITGTATVDGAALARTALAPAGVNLASLPLDETLVPTVLVTTVMKPRCKVTPVDRDGGRTVHRGTTFPAPVIVERLEAFDGEVLLQMAGRQTYHQQGIRGGDVLVPPGVGRIEYPCFMPEWLETSRTSRMILIGVTKVADPRGNVRYLVSPMDGRITMSLEGALLKVSHTAGELRAVPGQIIEVPVEVARSAKLAEPVTLELRLAAGSPALFSAEPVVVPPGVEEAVLRINTAADPALVGERLLTIRGTAMQQGALPVISETSVTVEFASLNAD